MGALPRAKTNLVGAPLVGALPRAIVASEFRCVCPADMTAHLANSVYNVILPKKLNESLNNRERKVDKKQTPTDKASKEDTPKVEKVKDTNNGQVPVRGSEASDEEVMAHAEESFKRNYRLGQLLAQ